MERQSASRRTPSAQVRGALVDAAVAVLERDGVAGLTVRAVATEAGVAPMGVYNHLDGKAGLLLAVLQRGFDGLRVAVSAPPGPGVERLLASGRGYRRFALERPTTYALMFGSADPSLDREALAPHAEPAFTALVDIVVDGQRSGAIRPGEPPDLARQIWSAVHGAVSLELAGDNSDKKADEEFYENLLEMVVRGIAP